jgi:hypothetical protein
MGNALASGGTWTDSDRRLKKDITPLSTNTLEKILKLQSINYFWKQKDYPQMHFGSEKQIGLIAQDVEKIFPEVVKTDYKGYKSVEYSKLSVLLIEGVKELNSKNEKLKAENAELSEKVKLIEQRLSKVEEISGISYPQKKANIFVRIFNWFKSLFK